jgi:uracil-DNA glycosylase
MDFDIEKETIKVLEKISKNSELQQYVDSDFNPPAVFGGNAKVRLIILGQDPTVKNPESRKNITTVLNLDKNGSLKSYITKICEHLGLDIYNDIYATNFFKNFFKEPPARNKMGYIFSEFKKMWFPLLQEELSHYKNVPVISLGEPILRILVNDVNKRNIRVRDYWDYNSKTKMTNGNFKYMEVNTTAIGKAIFPFPHQPSLSKPFYSNTLRQYLDFLRNKFYG